MHRKKRRSRATSAAVLAHLCWLIEIGASARRRWSSRFSSPRVITGVRQLRTILLLRVGVLGVVRVWVRGMVSIRVRVGVALVRGYGQGQFWVRVRVRVGLGCVVRVRVRVTVMVNTTQNPNPQP